MALAVDLFVQIVALFISLGGALYVTVIRPIQKSIDGLRIEIAEMRKDRISLLERVHVLEVNQTELKQSIKLFQKRLDELFGGDKHEQK